MNEIGNIKDVKEVESNKFENCPLARQLNNEVESSTETNYDVSLGKEIKEKIENLTQNYIDDLKNSSEYPETIQDEPFKPEDLIKRTPEETKALRQEFNLSKEKLISEWEKENGLKWPTYENDICNEYGEIVKKAGWKYDAHHIQPLSLGGNNEASNITPLRYDIHSDHKGVHAYDSPYDKLEKTLKEIEINE